MVFLFRAPSCPLVGNLLSSILMKRFFPIAMLCLLAASASAWADLLAHASVDRTWVAQVSKVDTPDGPGEQTDILVQQDGADRPWQKLASIPARAISLASR